MNWVEIRIRWKNEDSVANIIDSKLLSAGFQCTVSVVRALIRTGSLVVPIGTIRLICLCLSLCHSGPVIHILENFYSLFLSLFWVECQCTDTKE